MSAKIACDNPKMTDRRQRENIRMKHPSRSVTMSLSRCAWAARSGARALGFSLALLVAAGGAATAADPVSFKDKNVTMIIGFAAGGGTDLSGRLIAAFLGKFLPGQPNVIVQNMPGAEGMTAMNYFSNQVKPDGLSLTMGSGSVADPINFRKPQAKYDPSKYFFVGGAGRGGTMLIISNEAEKRLYDKSQPQVIMGSPGGSPRSGVLVTAWGIEFLGWNAKWVVGYKGTSDLFIALERGEIDMAATSSPQQIEKLVRTGKFKVLSQSGSIKEGRLTPRSDFPDAPLLPVMLAGKISDPVAAKSFEYWTSLESKDKWLALPPGTPADIVQVYRDAFLKMTQDPEFNARAKVMADDFTPTTWEDLQSWIKTMGDTSRESLDYLSVMLRHQGVAVE
jgi:tripartite-type tricarboxylate transporter receptor subunit TctC